MAKVQKKKDGEYLSDAIKDGQGSSVMISYSRKDKAFTKALHDALTPDGREIWVDWDDIPPSADWLDEIHRGMCAVLVCVVDYEYEYVCVCVCLFWVRLRVLRKGGARVKKSVFWKEGCGHCHANMCCHTLCA